MSFEGNKIIVGLSGGVDSAVTAFVLKEQGFDVRAVFMRNWSEAGGGCNWEWDFESAQAAVRHIGVELDLWDFEAAYHKDVYEPFIAAFEQGETPNPDVICNRYVKFGAFLKRARQEGADWVATGHYARITPYMTEKGYGLSLRSGVDLAKDQSYFLALISQEQLASTLFPLGNLTKKEVRMIAKAAGLPNAGRRDSFGICFVGEQDMVEFLRPRVKSAPGPIITQDGKKVADHDGLPFYTIGQRKGIGIGGTGPYYVVEKRVADNTLVVTANPNDPALYSDHAIVPRMHWIHNQISLPSKGEIKRGCFKPFHCLARHRHLQPLQEAVVEPFKDGGIKVIFDKPQRAVTPGQFMALYDGDICLGGGTIKAKDSPP